MGASAARKPAIALRVEPLSTQGLAASRICPARGARPRLLDLFCKAGGAAMGYHHAGFEVVGVDIAPQPRYPFQFIQADAMGLDESFLSGFHAIHASPPCQKHSDLAKRNRNADAWPCHIAEVRKLLRIIGRPHVIENVEGAPLESPTMLCGTMFPGLRVLRHRLFETDWPLIPPPHGKHPLCFTMDKRKAHYGKLNDMTAFVQVTGGGNCSVVAARDAMGIDWMTKDELNEAIPPAYTRFIGHQLMAFLFERREAA
jgi:DNA (cytosine-5)-methyltransferase 1